jgi:hypothetical protein
MAKTMAMCITLSNGEVSGGATGKGFQCEMDHRRPPIAATIKRGRSERGPHGKISACDFPGRRLRKVAHNGEST